MTKISQWIKHKLSAKAVILHYHRVTELPTDPHLLAVTPKHFAEHLEILRKFAIPLSLKQLIHSIQNQHIPHWGTVVTFDDGYADNLYQAKPVLERYEAPATIFIATGYVDGDREFWWDELDRILLQPGTLPETLCLRVHGNNLRWELGEATHFSEEDYQQQRLWKMACKEAPGSRQHLFRSLWQLLSTLHESDRRLVLQELVLWSGLASIVRPTHRTLSSEEVIHLAEKDLIEIGAHTVTHPVLSRLNLAEQRCEIQQSKAHLEEIISSPVTCFSYPHGLQADYTAETVHVVRDLDFTCACSSLTDIVRSDTDYYQLPRFLVRDWDGDEFERQLRMFFEN